MTSRSSSRSERLRHNVIGHWHIPALSLLLLMCSVSCGLLPGQDENNAPKDAGLAVQDSTTPPGRADSGDDTATSIDAGPCAGGCKPWQRCQSNQCVAKTCQSDSQCNQEAVGQDTEHWCVKGTCRAWQCEDDGDCGADQKCNTKTYRCYDAPTGCSYDAQCIDDKVCTDDTCDKPSGQCQHKVVSGCCDSDKSCDDGVACTSDACVQAKCVYQAKAGCCTSDAECADSSPCTTDSCVGGSCSFKAIAGCCKGDGGCDDGDDATEDVCQANQCVHTLPSMPTTCTKDSDCVGTACATGVCVQGACSWTKTPSGSCCSGDLQCAKDKACVSDQCVGWVCKSTPVSGKGVHFWERFDATALTGWSVTKGNTQAYFHLSNLLVFSGTGALRYGVPNQKTWSGGFPNKGSATSEQVAIPTTGAKATIRIFFDGEPSAAVHQFGVKVLYAKQTPKSVWSKNNDLKGNTAGKWVEANIDLSSWAGKKVQMQIWFDVGVAFPKEQGFGFVVDELRIEGGCP